MRQVLRRIAVNGGLAALTLGVVGLLFAELAGMWLAAESTGPRPGMGAPPAATSNDPLQTMLTHRIPLAMALWGFVFVAACELTIHFWRGKRPGTQALTATEPDPAEVLLEELMRQADEAMAGRGPGASPGSGVGKQESGVGGQESGNAKQESATTTPGVSAYSDPRTLTPDSRPLTPGP